MKKEIIGVAGGISTGKTTFCKKIIEEKTLKYINVDEFRRGLYHDKEYISKISFLKDEKIINSAILNKYIYTNSDYMQEYKDVLYKYLFDYLDTFAESVLVEWSEIINDNLLDKFDFIYLIKTTKEIQLKRLENTDLNKEQINKILDLQKNDNDIEILKKYKSTHKGFNYQIINN